MMRATHGMHGTHTHARKAGLSLWWRQSWYRSPILEVRAEESNSYTTIHGTMLPKIMASRVGNVLLSSSDMAGIFNICLQQPFIMLTFLVVYIRTTCKVLVLSSSRSKSIWRFCQKSDLDHSRDRYWLSPGSFLIWTKADSEFETGREGWTGMDGRFVRSWRSQGGSPISLYSVGREFAFEASLNFRTTECRELFFDVYKHYNLQSSWWLAFYWIESSSIHWKKFSKLKEEPNLTLLNCWIHSVRLCHGTLWRHLTLTSNIAVAWQRSCWFRSSAYSW